MLPPVPYANRSSPEGPTNAKTLFSRTAGNCEALNSPWQEKESLRNLHSSKPISHSHPISIPSTYNSEMPGESLTPHTLSVCSSPRNPLIKKRPLGLLPIHVSGSLGSVYANSDTSTPVGPGPPHGSYKFESGRVYENRNLLTPDSPLNVSSPLGKEHITEKSSTCESGSEDSEC